MCNRPKPHIDEQRALEVINRGGLGEALTHEWIIQVQFMKASVEFYIKNVHQDIQKLIKQLSKLERDAL